MHGGAAVPTDVLPSTLVPSRAVLILEHLLSFSVTRTARGQGQVLRVVGELDLATGPALEEAVDEALAAQAAGVAIDLTSTSFLDSSGARSLVLGSRRAAAAGARFFVVCPPHAKAGRVLDLMQLDRHIAIVPSVPTEIA